MNATMNMNGKARKSLASQIDRLDSMLDGLAGGLNEAVAAAVKEAVAVAVREAVQAVATEVVTNPSLLGQLRAMVAPTATSSDSTRTETTVSQPKTRLRACLAVAKSWIGRQIQAVCQTCRSAGDRVLEKVAALGLRTRQACITVQHSITQFVVGGWRCRRLIGHYLVQLLTALSIGLTLGTVAYCAEPWIAATVGGMAGLTLAWLVQVGLALRRRARELLGLSVP